MLSREGKHQPTEVDLRRLNRCGPPLWDNGPGQETWACSLAGGGRGPMSKAILQRVPEASAKADRTRRTCAGKERN
ncbi:hypothetical protein MAE02_48840 [Microvirga aerophila]|uniref:Uncharacterized protein n=1 Tax=Microvirga aerophila TaxID=670291 RepID=A0A512BZ25_9HYPH|nr:hypothetical protein MAE02_48840 [Microvirga aerophila]